MYDYFAQFKLLDLFVHDILWILDKKQKSLRLELLG
jgi:hypothetical protein